MIFLNALERYIGVFVDVLSFGINNVLIVLLWEVK
jgi:hypothetical protein